MIPKPVLGIMMLYECTPVQSDYNDEESKHLDPEATPKDLFYMKQFAHNACGTIALFHIIINALKRNPDIVTEDSYLKEFFE
jgi:ubiquitin carboxyl-terminal hydrolase L3